MLQGLVALDTILAAILWIASNCFFDSDDQLSHIESLYSSNGQTHEIYIFSSDYLLTLNFRTLKRLILIQAFTDLLSKCMYIK